MIQLLYFSTPTCGPCKMFKPVMQEVTANLGIPVQTIDASVQGDVAQQYGITSVPTIVVVKDGNVVFRNSGVMSTSKLIEALSQYK